MADSLQRFWQKINGECHFCHWWQKLKQRMITAMTFLLILLVALAVAGVVATFRDLFDDGGPRRAPMSHFEDPTFRAPAARI
ncbi:MAG TPA: hypothetical protein VFO49_07990 [Nocardioides sp.]|nr:hypothetical protein [Nocardioides sp.]